jgi:hypothetical protein
MDDEFAPWKQRWFVAAHPEQNERGPKHSNNSLQKGNERKGALEIL